MKKSIIFLFFILLFSSLSGIAQLKKPAKWVFESSPQTHKKGDVITLSFKAKIDKGWYLYSSDFDPDLGPIVTTINFEKNADYQLIGGIKPINPKKKYDDLWEGDITYFTKTAEFQQQVKLLKDKASIKGYVDYQVCTEVDGSCVPGKNNFNFNLVSTVDTPTKTVEPTVIKQEPVVKPNVSTIVPQEQVAAAPKTTEAVTKLNNEVETLNNEVETLAAENTETILEEAAPIENIEVEASSSDTETPEPMSLWKFLVAALGAGVASIFMPCIYPIMPMTVSFFTKQSNGKSKAFIYGLFIMLIFGAIGLVTMAFGAPFLNFISTHWVPNLLFFAIFILFGFSLLGAFEIVLPHSMVNKIDSMSGAGGIIGLFFMALTLVVVSFSCTVPFVSSLLIMSTNGEVIRPLYGMLAFGFPFAAVFTLLAIFPQFLKELPKSGGWLNELKVVFGFLEFALALKFLSNIDLVYHFNKIDRSIFLTIWIVIFVIIGLYILGYMRMPKDSKVEKRTPLRWFFALIFFAFSAYMLYGVPNRPLSALSGLLPPMQVSNTQTKELKEDQRELPHGLVGFKEYENALAYAKEVNKPLLIDFTGYACANCRKMEEFIWPDPSVLALLKEDFVIASLYVDDKEALPESKQYISSYDQEKITTIGEKNMDFEITKFNNNAQPYYVILDKEGNLLNQPVGYLKAPEFTAFLKEGLSKFKE